MAVSLLFMASGPAKADSADDYEFGSNAKRESIEVSVVKSRGQSTGDSSAPGGSEKEKKASSKQVPSTSRPDFFKIAVRPGDADLGCSTVGDRGTSLACGVISSACAVTGNATGNGNAPSVVRTVSSNSGAAKNGFSFGCNAPGGTTSSSSGGEAAAPVMPVVTQTDLQSLDIAPLTAHLGPPGGWIPVGADTIVYAETEQQTLETQMLGQNVTVRATPVSYEWSFGDGTVLTTAFPGQAYPERDIAAQYRFEGWYELKLTAVFRGEYSVNGGPFQPVDGTVRVESEPQWIYADARVARLVDGPVDDERTEIPDRTAESLGPKNPDAVVRTLKVPGANSVGGE